MELLRNRQDPITLLLVLDLELLDLGVLWSINDIQGPSRSVTRLK